MIKWLGLPVRPRQQVSCPAGCCSSHLIPAYKICNSEGMAYCILLFEQGCAAMPRTVLNMRGSGVTTFSQIMTFLQVGTWAIYQKRNATTTDACKEKILSGSARSVTLFPLYAKGSTRDPMPCQFWRKGVLSHIVCELIIALLSCRLHEELCSYGKILEVCKRYLGSKHCGTHHEGILSSK